MSEEKFNNEQIDWAIKVLQRLNAILPEDVCNNIAIQTSMDFMEYGLLR
nr:MAG TPA: hypothetical protein [Caudoviricetes sp.]